MTTGTSLSVPVQFASGRALDRNFTRAQPEPDGLILVRTDTYCARFAQGDYGIPPAGFLDFVETGIYGVRWESNGWERECLKLLGRGKPVRSGRKAPSNFHPREEVRLRLRRLLDGIIGEFVHRPLKRDRVVGPLDLICCVRNLSSPGVLPRGFRYR